jgi:hypothetical protein
MVRGLRPDDPIEWMPFLQAYMIAGDEKQVKILSTRLNTEPFYQHQACMTLNAMVTENLLSSEMQNRANELFCK